MILIADSNEDYAQELAAHLQAQALDTEICRDGDTAIKRLLTKSYDLCVLDLSLACKDGFQVMLALRNVGYILPGLPQSSGSGGLQAAPSNQLGVIILTGRYERQDMLRAFESGCDDYLFKSLPMDVVVGHVQAVLRRCIAGHCHPQTVYDLGGVRFDAIHQQFGDRHLTARENDILLILCRNRNTMVERSHILLALWGTDDYYTSRSLSVYVNRLRNIISPSAYRILSIHRKGYKLVDNEG
ncbi:MAG: response regulator transcription factor [Paludibacteraceae bacterium]